MRDKSLDILLMTLFGTSGIVILLLAWLQPMADSERILTTLIGSVGLLLASIKAKQVKSPPVMTGNKPKTVKVGTEDNLSWS